MVGLDTIVRGKRLHNTCNKVGRVIHLCCLRGDDGVEGF